MMNLETCLQRINDISEMAEDRWPHLHDADTAAKLKELRYDVDAAMKKLAADCKESGCAKDIVDTIETVRGELFRAMNAAIKEAKGTGPEGGLYV